MCVSAEASAVDELLSVRQVASRLGVEVATLVNWHVRGGGPPFAATSGGRLAYSAHDLERWQDDMIANQS